MPRTVCQADAPATIRTRHAGYAGSVHWSRPVARPNAPSQRSPAQHLHQVATIGRAGVDVTQRLDVFVRGGGRRRPDGLSIRQLAGESGGSLGRRRRPSPTLKRH